MNTVYISVCAGLGNQLFMSFTGISYAIDNNFNFMIYSLNRPVCITCRKHYSDSIFKNIKDKILYNYNDNLPVCKQKIYNYQKIPYLNYDFNLVGHFESYKYFEHNYEKIMQTLKLYEQIDEVKNKYNYYFKKKTIGIHFRFGDVIKADYLNPGLNMLLSPNYYNYALSYLETFFNNIKDDYDILYFNENVNNDKIMIDEYIKIINKDRNYNFIKVSDDIEDYEQLLLMSLCDHFIIANSTFSLFGAYFNSNKDKKIIYPSLWGGPNSPNTYDDLFPNGWIEISRN